MKRIINSPEDSEYVHCNLSSDKDASDQSSGSQSQDESEEEEV
jgi:hypothetical protein